MGPNVTPSTSLFWFLGKLGACRIKSNSQSNSWATERSPDRWDRGAADLPRDGADDGGLDRGGAGDVASSARTGPVYAHVHMHPGAWAKTERAGLRAPGERSRERPLLVLLVLWLARTSLPRHQPHSLNQSAEDHARRRGAVLHHIPHLERLRWASRLRRGAAGPQIRGFGTRKGALSARRDAPLSRFFSRMRTSLLSRSSSTPQGVHAHGRTPALFASSSPQKHRHPGLSLHHRHHLALRAAELSLNLTGRSGTAGMHTCNIPRVAIPITKKYIYYTSGTANSPQPKAVNRVALGWGDSYRIGIIRRLMMDWI